MAVVISDIRDRVETDLSDAAISKIIAAEIAAIEKVTGAVSSRTDTLLASGLRSLMLRHPIGTITSISERRCLDDDAVVLAGDDYRVIGSRGIYRVSDGTNPATYWGQQVDVTYSTSLNSDLFDEAVIKLVILTIQFNGLDREECGDYKAEQKSYKAARQDIIDSIDCSLTLA